jgi:hypothetical protein
MGGCTVGWMGRRTDGRTDEWMDERRDIELCIKYIHSRYSSLAD